MDVRQLKIFLAVVEHRSFSKAASAIFLTQSGVSYQIATLESNLGIKLFHRGPRELKLTEAGQHCHRVIQKLVGEYDRMAHEGRRIAAKGTGRLSIGIHGGCEISRLPEWVSALNQAHPGIEVHLTQFQIDAILPAVRARELDLGFTLFFEQERFPDLNCQPILKDPMVVAMCRSHPLAARESLRLADLSTQAFLYLNPPKRGVGGRGLEWRKKLCRKRGFEMEVVQTFPSFQSLFLAVESGVGIALFGKHTVLGNASPHIHYVPLADPDCFYEHGMVWDRQNQNPSIEYFLRAAGFPITEP